MSLKTWAKKVLRRRGAAERVDEVQDRLLAVPGLTPARRPKQPAGKPMKTKGTVSDLLPEQRR
ncbi:MAG: hypothetical protein KY395_00300 [Actinobacteria bacterium]|nr:hypothetical protein [Actinomycetota bacterium]